MRSKLIVLFLLVFTSCGKQTADSTPDSSPVALSGQFTITGSSATTGRFGIPGILGSSDVNASQVNDDIYSIGRLGSISSPLKVSASDLTVYCKTNEANPASATGTVGADGKFSINLPSAKGKEFTCIAQSGTSTVGTFILQDSSKKSMGGAVATQESMALNSDSNLGTVTLDTDSGEALVDASVISNSLVTVDTSTITPFDFTGTWKAVAVDFTLPTGYVGACATQGQDCHGPAVGDKFYLQRIAGKEFTPDATCLAAAQNGTFTSSSTCNGTTGTKTRYGVMAWLSQTAYTSCGSKLGFTYDQGKAYAQVDLTNSGVGSGALTWSTSIPINGSTATLTEGWKFSTATASWPLMDCTNVIVAGKRGYKCKDNNSAHAATYEVSLGGGCVNASNTPVEVKDWSGVTSCSTQNLTGDFANYKKMTCTGTYQGASVTCSHISGQFKQADDSVADPNTFHWNHINTLLAQNSTCASMNPADDRQTLAQLQCYAQYYWQNQSQVRNENYCVRKIETDWTATSSANFLFGNGPARAVNQYVLEAFVYSSANSGSLRTAEKYVKGAQIVSNGNNIWINCKVMDDMVIKVKKISDTRMLMEFNSESRLLDTQRADCKAVESKLGTGAISRAMFYVDKQ